MRLADELGAERLAAIQQEHTPSGKHVNMTTPFPTWVDAATRRAAAKLSLEDARAQLPMLASRTKVR